MVKRIILIAAILLLAATARNAAAQEVVVIVNAANEQSSISRARLSAIFLKKRDSWDDGAPATPVDQIKGSVTREVFARRIHGKSASALDTYWQQRIFAGIDGPPAERSSDADVIAFVRGSPHAVGYVSAGSALPPDIRVLTINGS